MAIKYNTTIVRNGLVLHLDAANTKSYPGSGTAWNDLSGNKNHGTLGNAVGYSANNTGSMVFDGVDDYVDCGGNASIKPTSAITVSAWFKFTTITSNNRILSDWHQAGVTGDRWIFYNPTASTVTWYMISSVTGEAGVPVAYTPTLNQWVNLVGTYNGSNQILYVNGAEFSSRARTGLLYAGNSTQTVRIGRQAESGGSLNGNISQVSIYNRALSAQEIQQNFEAMRGRYGL